MNICVNNQETPETRC